MSKANGKPSEQASGLVPQPHGGALKPGAGGGRKNGSLGGRPPSAIRERCRGSFVERIPILEEIADDATLRPNDRVKAIDVLAKYGGVDKLALTVEEQPDQAMTPERVAALWETIQRVRTIKELETLLISAAKDQAG